VSLRAGSSRSRKEPEKEAMLRDAPKERDSLTNAMIAKNETNNLAWRITQRRLGRSNIAYWLITKDENGRLEVLVTSFASTEEALPVFSHEEEAELFLRLWEVEGEGWQVRESTVGEIISVLYGPCVGVKRVALDPLPEMVAERTLGLVSLRRERFLELVLSLV
jgi:hypothetical protein